MSASVSARTRESGQYRKKMAMRKMKYGDDERSNLQDTELCESKRADEGVGRFKATSRPDGARTMGCLSFLIGPARRNDWRPPGRACRCATADSPALGEMEQTPLLGIASPREYCSQWAAPGGVMVPLYEPQVPCVPSVRGT